MFDVDRLLTNIVHAQLMCCASEAGVCVCWVDWATFARLLRRMPWRRPLELLDDRRFVDEDEERMLSDRSKLFCF